MNKFIEYRFILRESIMFGLDAFHLAEYNSRLPFHFILYSLLSP